MKRWLLTGIALFALGTQIAWSAPPGLPQLLQATGEREERRIDVVPDPASLRADWWLYFNVGQDVLRERVAETEALLRRRYGEAQGAGGRSFSGLIDRIAGQLDAMLAASRLQAPEPRPAPPLADSYTPAEALELVSALRKARVELELESSEVQATQLALQSTLEQVDRDMATYLQLEPGTPKRLADGFEIMLQRSTAAVTEQQLRLRRAALDNQQAQLRELSSIENFAEDHLRGDEADLANIAEQLAAVETEIERAQERLLNETRRMLEPVGGDLLDQYSARYRQQRAVLAEIELASLEIRRLNLTAQAELSRLLADPDAPAEAATGLLVTLRDKGEAVRSDARQWRSTSERERERAGERLAESDAADAAGLINQDRVRLAQLSINGLRALDEELVRSSYLVRWINQALHARQGVFGRVIGRLGDSTLEARAFLASVTDRSLFKLGETPITLNGIARFVMVVVIAWLISWLLRRMLARLARRFPKENMALTFVVSRLAHYLIIGIGLIAGLSTMGLNLTNFALVAGALALGLGFGLQSIVNNFLSGLILFFERSVKVGDFVELDNGERGEVRAINVRGTIVNTNDNVDVVVPNSQFIERKVVNWTLQDPFRRIHVPFRVAYESDEDKVVEAGLEAAGRLSSTLTGVLGREPSVWLVNYGENGFEFELIVWLMPDAVKRPDAVFAAYHWEIRKALRRHGIEVPVPQREIRFRGEFPQALDRITER